MPRTVAIRAKSCFEISDDCGIAPASSDFGSLREACVVAKTGKPRWPGFQMEEPEKVWTEIESRDYLQPTGTAWDRVYRTLFAAWKANPRGIEEP